MLGQHPLAVRSIAADYLVSDRYPGERFFIFQLNNFFQMVIVMGGQYSCGKNQETLDNMEDNTSAMVKCFTEAVGAEVEVHFRDEETLLGLSLKFAD
nr:hypothetical protein [Tanacetum cinerariifolium]